MHLSNRRQLLQRGPALLGLGALPGGARPAATSLRVLAWPGYAEPEVVQAFEQRYGVRVELTIIDTDEAMWARASRGEEFDLLALNTAELQRYLSAGLVQALDPVRIPNSRRQLPRFRERAKIPGLLRQASCTRCPIPSRRWA